LVTIIEGPVDMQLDDTNFLRRPFVVVAVVPRLGAVEASDLTVRF